MKKLLTITICAMAFACTSPEHNVDDAADTAGLNYQNDQLNTPPGPAANDNNTNLDTTATKVDTAGAYQ